MTIDEEFFIEKQCVKDIWYHLPENEDTFMMQYMHQLILHLSTSFNPDNMEISFLLLCSKDKNIVVNERNIQTIAGDLPDEVDHKNILVHAVKTAAAELDPKYVVHMSECFAAKLDGNQITGREIKFLEQLKRGDISVRQLPKALRKELMMVTIVNKEGKTFSLYREIIRDNNNEYLGLGDIETMSGVKYPFESEDAIKDNKPSTAKTTGRFSDFWDAPEPMIEGANSLGVSVDPSISNETWTWDTDELEAAYAVAGGPME